MQVSCVQQVYWSEATDTQRKSHHELEERMYVRVLATPQLVEARLLNAQSWR